MTFTTLLWVAFLLQEGAQAQRFLGTEETDFVLNGEKVYLSGMNIAWHDFGMDFGEGRYDASTGAALEDYLKRISEAGSNSISIFFHVLNFYFPFLTLLKASVFNMLRRILFLP